MYSLIKKARKERGLTLDALVKLSGISKVSLVNYENFKVSTPTVAKIEKLCKVLDLSQDEVLAQFVAVDIEKSTSSQVEVG